VSLSRTLAGHPRSETHRRERGECNEIKTKWLSGMTPRVTRVGSAVGLAVLVAIANSGTEGVAGEALRVATTDGLRSGVFAAAAGIAATILIALSIKKPSRARIPRARPRPSPTSRADHDARRTVRLHG
jgi:hypothetical protein